MSWKCVHNKDCSINKWIKNNLDLATPTDHMRSRPVAPSLGNGTPPTEGERTFFSSTTTTTTAAVVYKVNLIINNNNNGVWCKKIKNWISTIFFSSVRIEKNPVSHIISSIFSTTNHNQLTGAVSKSICIQLKTPNSLFGVFCWWIQTQPAL